MYINATIIKGTTKGFGCSIEVRENADIFKPLDLSDISIRFRVLGSATGDAKVLVEHLITQNSNVDTEGVINDPVNGEFVFTISKEDTEVLGLGEHPISLTLLDAASGDELYQLTEGNTVGEFSKILIVQV